jgi:hypothetical protein
VDSTRITVVDAITAKPWLVVRSVPNPFPPRDFYGLCIQPRPATSLSSASFGTWTPAVVTQREAASGPEGIVLPILSGPAGSSGTIASDSGGSLAGDRLRRRKTRWLLPAPSECLATVAITRGPGVATARPAVRAKRGAWRRVPRYACHKRCRSGIGARGQEIECRFPLGGGSLASAA